MDSFSDATRPLRTSSLLLPQAAACVLGASLLLVAAPGLAQDDPAQPSSNDEATEPAQVPTTEAEKSAAADRLFEEAKRAAAIKNWEQAHASLTKAYALKPSHDIAANLGKAAFETGRYSEAAQRLTYALEVYPATGSPEKRAGIEAFLRDQIMPRVATIEVVVQPAGAKVRITEAVAGVDPTRTPVYVPPGHIELHATLEGYSPTDEEIQARVGMKYLVRLQLVKEGAGTGSATTTEMPASEPTPAAHRANSTTSSPLASNSTVPPAGSDPTADRPAVPLWPTWIGVGVTAVAVGTAIGFTAVGLDNGRSAEDQLADLGGTNPCGAGSVHPDACADIADSLDRENSQHTGALVGWIAAGTIGAATAAYATYAIIDRKKRRMEVGPQAGAWGLRVQGTF